MVGAKLALRRLAGRLERICKTPILILNLPLVRLPAAFHYSTSTGLYDDAE